MWAYPEEEYSNSVSLVSCLGSSQKLGLVNNYLNQTYNFFTLDGVLGKKKPKEKASAADRENMIRHKRQGSGTVGSLHSNSELLLGVLHGHS